MTKDGDNLTIVVCDWSEEGGCFVLLGRCRS